MFYYSEKNLHFLTCEFIDLFSFSTDEGGQPATLVHSPETMSVTMTSPKCSSADSDSDSTSTELCDEPDRLSDVDSEEPTSSSDCYVMATDDEKSPRLGSSPIAGQTPARIQPEVRNEFASVNVVVALPETHISEPLGLEETSIAEITDQIRRLSAGDNNIIVTGVSSDSEIEKKSSDPGAQVSLEDGSFDYNFLGDICRVESDQTKFQEIPSPDSKGVSYDYKSYSPIERVISDSNLENNSLSEVTERTYSKNYVVGHLPISPLTVDKKLKNVGQFESNGWSNLDYIYQRTVENKKSPKTPESASSGETMGPDSKPSSLAMSPRTPMRSDSRALEKSTSSSISSDSKTLTLQSVEVDLMVVRAKLEPKVSSFDKSCSSTPISVDSLKAKSDCSPKLVVSSSSESYSPNKLKSSERSFSSDLQSPISANSIKYSSNYKDNGDLSDTPPIELVSITSPFYPIAHPNQKTPSPYDTISKKETQVSPNLKYSVKSDYPLSTDFTTKSKDNEIGEHNFESDLDLTVGGSAFRNYQKSKFDEDLDKDDDSLSPLPRENSNNRFDTFGVKRKENSLSERSLFAKPFERSCSSLDKKFPDLTSSNSNEELASSVKKRSSDILEDLKHLESKSDGPSDTNMLTKKTGYIWEDVQNLEARRQDTFSDSASGFSISRLNIPGISISNENRKTYIVEPKINIDESSDSILKKVAQNSSNRDDDRESKLGVWTKVKPRNNGRRSSSDRALKIIQENSAILQKILTCQAKKRLPDLEEISKEITISPINEEISKIFSPILEKMGLNEHEINEELAKINFKDLGHMASTTSEFDAKINDELCKLSLIGDDDDIDPVDLDEIISQDYLETRDAFIDRQINEELSKLLSNYDGGSVDPFKRNQLAQNNVDIYEYKKTESIEPRNGLSSQEEMLHSDQYNSYVNPIQFHSMSQSSNPMNHSLNSSGHSLNPMNQTFSSEHQAFSYHTFNPAHQTFNPVHQKFSPVHQTFNSVHQTFNPVHQTFNPVHQTLSPLNQTLNPVGQILSPLSQTLNPLSQTLNPQPLSSLNQSLSPLNQSLSPVTQSYNSNHHAYSTTKYSHSKFTPKSDIDIYRELEKLDQISSVQVLPSSSQEIPETIISTLPYIPQNASYSEVRLSSLDYSTQAEKPFDSSPLKSPYDTYKPYDYKHNLSPRISPRKSPTNSYTMRGYEKSYADSTFENFDFELNHKKVLSKESLEFRVRYDEEQPKSKELNLSPFQSDLKEFNMGASYYKDKSITPTNNIPLKFASNDERFLGKNEDRFLGSSATNGDRFLGANEERFMGSTNGEAFLGSTNGERFLGSSNGERFLGSSNEERFLGATNEEKFLGDTNEERFMGSKNEERFLGSGNEDRFLGSIDKEERFLGSGNEDKFLGIAKSEERFLGSSGTNEERFLGSSGTNEERFLRSSGTSEERFSRSTILSPLDYKYDRMESYLPRKHESISPKDYGNSKIEFDRQPYKVMDPEMDAESFLITGHSKESHLVSPSNQFNREFAQSSNPFLAQMSSSLEETSRRPVSHPEFPGKLNVTQLNDLPSGESANHKKSSLSLGNIGYTSRLGFDGSPSPKSNFSPFPVRNAPRKPKELGLKLGLYSPTSLGNGQGKKS